MLKITRRQVLAAMGLVGAVSGAGALGMAWSWWDRPPGQGLKALSDVEYEVTQALAEAWMPPGGEPAISGADADLGGFLDAFLHAMGGQQEVLLKLLLQAIDDLTLISHQGHFRSLPLDTRIELLRGWLNHDNYLVRNAITSVMALLSMGWTLHPQVQPRIQELYWCRYGP